MEILQLKTGIFEKKKKKKSLAECRKVSEIEDRSIEIIQFERMDRKHQKHEQIVSDLQGHIKRSNICVTGVPKGEKEKISTLKKKKI